ncbi:MAG: VCBS repeat-containing protein [Myxococcales bacterium]|nr:VCBS repeat-containing protein [Myxococcales bacterium]
MEVCRDRACTAIEHSFDATGSSGVPGVPLAAGAHFWRLYTRTATELGERASPTWEFVVTPRAAPVDTTWGTLPDFNGDGLGDVVINAGPVAPDTRGNAYEYLGRVGGISATPSQRLRVPTDTTSLSVADALAAAADVNGDGFADLVTARTGSVLLFYGGPAGLPAAPNAMILPPEVGRTFSRSVDGAGDINGDGYGDVLVGADGGAQGGRAYAYFGGPAGIAATPGFVLRPPVRLGRGAEFATRVAGIGDANNDGFADAAVSALDDSRRSICRFNGSATGFTVSICEDEIDVSYSTIPVLTRAGDFNGDGLADMAFVGGVRQVDIILGGGRGTTVIVQPMTDDGAVASVASVGDVDGDGFDDLAVATVLSSVRPDRTSVYRGRSANYIYSADGYVSTINDTRGGSFGSALAGAGDLNGDGVVDLVVGSPRWDSSQGRAYVYNGAPTGFPTLPSLILESPGGVLFGALLAK